jgi:acetyl esterase/lipase
MIQRLAIPCGRAARPGGVLASVALAALLLAALSLAGATGPASPASAAVMTGSARSAAAAVTAGPTTPSLSCPTTPYGVTETLATYGSPANGQALDLDEYQPVGDPQAHVPGVILVHGGGWAEGNFTKQAGDSLTTIGDCLAENGFDAFSVDYALSVGGNGSFPENLQDINEAIGWVKAHVSNLNTAQMFILGTSAGGNLAALAGENAMGYQDGLLGVITQSGPADLTAAGMGCASAANCKAGSPGATIEKYLGCLDNSSATCTLYFQDGTTQTVPAATAYADASPTASLSATVPAPPYLVANSSDEAIPLAQATDLTQQLNAQCTATKAATSDQLVVLPGDQHALTYSDILAGPMLSFLNAVLAGSLPKNCATATPLTGASMAYDANASAKTAILFGGCCTAAAKVSGTTQSFNTTTGAWTPVKITGSAPVPRLGASFGYDPTSGDLVLFGGEYLPGGSAQPVALNDTWELSYQASTNTGTWTQVGGSGCLSTCTGAPPARYGGAADQAPRNEGLVLFGGENMLTATQSGAPLADGDTWLWNGTWTKLTPTGSPPPRYGATLSDDGGHNTDVLFGGDDATSSCDASCLALLNDTWTLTFNTATGAWTWANKGTAPAGLTPRDFAAGASAINSSVTGAVLFGGMSGSTGTNVNSDQVLGDTWTWNGANSTWAQACTSCTVTPPPAIGAAIAYHRANVEDLLYGGYSDTGAPAAPSTTWIWTANWAAG